MNALVEFITSKLRWARVGTLPLPEELPPVNITKILANPQRILIIPYNQMGTVLLTTRVFKAIRDHYSSSKLSVIVHTVWSALVQKDPTIDEVISFGPYIDNPRSKEFQSFARDLATRQFDLALYFSTQFNEPITYLARLSEAKVRLSLWNTENEKRGYFNVEIKPSHSSRN
jgi:ADP-heptose:LPS heptosyltransferase